MTCVIPLLLFALRKQNPFFDSDILRQPLRSPRARAAGVLTQYPPKSRWRVQQHVINAFAS